MYCLLFHLHSPFTCCLPDYFVAGDNSKKVKRLASYPDVVLLQYEDLQLMNETTLKLCTESTASGMEVSPAKGHRLFA